MKITVKKSSLLKALNYVQSVVEKRNAIPILGNVKLEASDGKLILTTTDMDISITTSIDASVDDALSTTIPVLTFYEIVKKISDSNDIVLEMREDNQEMITVKAGASKFTLPCLSTQNFPNFEIAASSHNFQISSQILKVLFNKTKHAISQEETRYYLNGVYLHTTDIDDGKILRAVATDGHRLAKVDTICPNGAEEMPGIIIPKKTVMELIKLLEANNEDINISLSSTKAVFEIGHTKLISKLIDGKFPDYNRVIPTSNNKMLEVSSKDLAKSIELVIAVSNDKTRAVKFDIQSSKVTLSASSELNGNASGTQVLDVNFAHDPLTIGFNSRYVLDSLNVIEGDTVKLNLGTNNGAVIASDSANNNCMYILMPMQV